jgi:methylenetetrahydrofolate reductase (NADPH)
MADVASSTANVPFEIVCEIQPATRPDLMAVRHQICVMSRVASAFLIPDNHLGRATVSSIAVAHEVDQMGGRAIACLNARDRNLLGFRRDLLTAAAYNVDEFLLVFGDRPSAGGRTPELSVRTMLEELRTFAGTFDRALRVGVSTRLGALAGWKQSADFLYVQVSYGLEELLIWRDAVSFEGPMYAGVLVPPSAARARKWAQENPDFAVPESWIEALDRDPGAGVELACELVAGVRDASMFAGVHLVPGVRYREVITRLERSGL